MKKLPLTQAASKDICSALRAIYSACIALLFCIVQPLYAQDGVRIAGTAGTADPSAMLDVISSSKGVLIPRMSSAQRLGIAAPATGLLVYQTDGTPGFYYNAGTPGAPNWVILSAGAISGVGLTNYAARWTSPSLLGTGVIVDNGTNVGIGTSNPAAKLHVLSAAPISSTGTPAQGLVWIGGKNDVDNNQFINFRNPSNTDGSISGMSWWSSDIVFGRYRNETFWGFKETHDGGLGNAQKDIMRAYVADGGGFTNLSKLVIAPNNGNVGIGTANPVEKLDVTGSIRSSSLSGSNIHLSVDPNGVIKKLTLAYVTGNSPEDATDVGYISGRSVTFTKMEASTKLRISYTDNLRTYCNVGGRCCRWSFRIDGGNCPSQFLGYDYYCSIAGENFHHARTVVGYCGSVGAGTHTVQVYVESCPGYGGSDCHTGWQAGSAWVLEVEEVY